jgi:hypothetical protein
VYDALSGGKKYTTRGKSFYEITITPLGGGNQRSTFLLTAVAVKAPQVTDGNCKEMTLAHTGVKAPADCW